MAITEKKSANCIDCRFARLVRYSEGNPVIAICQLTGTPDVARLYSCRHFEMMRGKTTIERRYEGSGNKHSRDNEH